jgi:hypothetical protein
METIETEKFIMRIHDESGLLEYIVKPQILMDNEALLLGKKLLSEARPGKKFFILAEGIEMFTVTKEARKLAASKEYSDNTHAIAFYTINPSMFFLGKMYQQINKPAVPTNVFLNRDEALEWLTEKMRSAQ